MAEPAGTGSGSTGLQAGGEAIEFPAGFVWGASTASYQIEGAAREGGRGPSIWDTFSASPGKVYRGHTGSVACDHYHRFADDVALMADIGLDAYRFSVAWPRIQPEGSGPANPVGLDFYDRLVDELLGRGIAPILTLYHWDLPQALQDRGGWVNRDTAELFVEYAAAVHARLGDRVQTWTTLNEPWCAAFLGYGSGLHAPGIADPAAALAATHHLLLGHGLAVRELRSAGAARLGITLNPTPVRGPDPEVTGYVHAVRNRLFLDPLVHGTYPAEVLAATERFTDWSFVADGDLAAIGAPIDVLGVNYYRPMLVRARPGAPGSPAFPGTEGIEFVRIEAPTTGMDWEIVPDGLTELLVQLGESYPGVPLHVMENGAAFDDQLVDGRVRDDARIAFLAAHLRAVYAAIKAGVDVRGYTVWSLLDNFEWAEGYWPRFGLIYVDYRTQQRYPKDSAAWYGKVIRRNGLGEA